MKLLIDAGNTRIKWALVAPAAPLGAWLAQGAVAHADSALLPRHWQAGASGAGATLAAVTSVLAANVAGAALAAQLAAAVHQAMPAAGVAWFASLPALAGLTNGYRNPAQLGCDRFAAAIGGRHLAPGRAIIVANCGTATTIDAITADGVFLGGMILPGLALMASALARNTAQLPQIAPDAKLRAGFADNTDDAILSGCLAAQSGAIEHACAMHGAQACLVSGGAAPHIAPMLGVPHRMVDNIVLIGLHAAAGSA